MSNWTRLSGTTAFITLMTGSAVYADVTAQQVWGDWKDYMSGFGYTMTASEATSGKTLTVSDLKMGMTLPEDAGVIALSMGEMTFTNRGDGTVEIGIPAVLPIDVSVAPKGEEKVDLTVNYTNTGFSMIVSGTAEEMTYNYTAADIGVALDKVAVDGKPVTVGVIEMAVKNIVGSSVMKIANLRQVSQSMKTGAVSYNLDVANPESAKETFKAKGGFDSMEFAGNGAYPTGEFNVEDLNAMLRAGFSFAGMFNYVGGNSAFTVVDGDDTIQGQSSSKSGAFTVAMDESQLKYDVAAKGMSMTMQGGDIPFPVAIDMADSGFKLVMPVTKSDEDQDFALGVTLGDFTMSDMIWSLFDPSAQLPRDPATIAFDVSGKAKLLLDLFDPEQMKTVERGQAVPGEVHEVSINSMTVAAAGAKLTGDGAFTIDNTDTKTFDGMPKPTGAANFKLVGGNGLIDKLVAMGLVPEEQAMGARMMMSMFTVPGDGADTLTSKIEVNDAGHVLANGQRLK